MPAQASNWNALVSDTYADLGSYQSQSGGLMCEWASNQNCESGFSWEATRWPWRIATDSVWSGDSAPEQMLQTLSNYIDDQGGITALQYNPNSAFDGGLALSGVVRDEATFDNCVAGWLSMATDDNAFYQATVKVLFMQLASGQMQNPF